VSASGTCEASSIARHSNALSSLIIKKSGSDLLARLSVSLARSKLHLKKKSSYR
jgi:hypothetical protein